MLKNYKLSTKIINELLVLTSLLLIVHLLIIFNKNEFIFTVLAISSVVIFSFRKNTKEIDYVLFALLIASYLVPYLGFLLIKKDINYIFYILFLTSIIIYRHYFKFKKHYHGSKKTYGILQYLPQTLAIVFIFIAPPLYLGCLAMSFLILERICINRPRGLHPLIYTSTIYILILVEMLILWDGGGRLFRLTLMIIPLLILSHYQIIRINKIQLAFLIPAGLIVGEMIRSEGAMPSLVSIALGSSGHHLLLMNDLLNDSEKFTDQPGALFGQYFLMLFNWIPRDYFEFKPIGISLTIVDSYFGREGFSESHNVSTGLWGEHIYLLPSFWPLTGLITIIISIFIGRIIFAKSDNSYAVLYIYIANLTSLIWGGMGSFGARVWWFIIPILLFLSFEKLIKK